jgi:hypothetical protein
MDAKIQAIMPGRKSNAADPARSRLLCGGNKQGRAGSITPGLEFRLMGHKFRIQHQTWQDKRSYAS